MKISGKLIFSYLLIVLLMIGIGSYALVSLSSVNQNGAKMYSNSLIPISQLGNIYGTAENTRVQMLQAINSHDPSFADQAEKNFAQIDQDLQTYAGTSMSLEEKDLFNSFQEKWGDYKTIAEENISLIKNAKFVQAQEGVKKAKTEFENARDSLLQLIKSNESNADKLIKANNQSYSTTSIYLIITMAFAIILSIGIGLIMGKLLGTPIRKISERMDQIAQGDLTAGELVVKNKDEIGVLVQSANKMVKDLREMITSIDEASTQVAASSEELTASAEESSKASEQIASAIQQLASGTEDQRNSVNEASIAINKMSVGIQQIAATSEEVSQLAENATNESEKGAKIVEGVMIQMNEINTAVEETAEMVKDLGERSKDIGDIVDLITSIASQTNLLALNAAIEAARAGEHGKGFSVVADEVRKLAEQSQSSAKQISDLIAIIQTETENAVSSMVKGTEKVSQGVMKTQQVHDSFQTIENSIVHVTEKVQEVADSIEQMAAGSQQITSAIENVSKIAEGGSIATQENAAASQEQLATMEEISASALSLSHLAENMHGLLSKFKV